MAKIFEKQSSHEIQSSITYEENKPKAFDRSNTVENSYRVYEDGKVGIFYRAGHIDDAEGFRLATADPERLRPYPFMPEAGGKRDRSKVESTFTDREVMETAEKYMKYLTENYPQFTFAGGVDTRWCCQTLTNDLGTDYSNTDFAVGVGFRFKHKDSLEMIDGGFSFNLRKMDDGTVFREMADLYLSNYEKEAEIPDEIIIDEQYYGLLGILSSELNAENLALGASRLSGKVGEKIFADDFTLEHDMTDKEAWFTRFWDGEGCVLPEEKLVLIENGVIKTGYSDKRVADKYNVPHTRTAYHNYTDLPGPGGLNLRIKRSEKTVKELLNGRPAVIPLQFTGSDMDANGDMTVVISKALLWDGDKVLGHLPEFRVKANFIDIFGKDFLGVGSDDPIYHDKQILYRVHRV
ncbi:MAG: hypothetical protein J5648_02125 [Lachnospiraceae bacterium]|nr:hypothetical protein [Lachnospiraceae bacterium]